MRCGGHFGLNVIISQMHAVITGLCRFRLFVVARTVSLFGSVKVTSPGVEMPDSGHDKEIAHVAIPADAAELRHGKSFDRGVFVGIS